MRAIALVVVFLAACGNPPVSTTPRDSGPRTLTGVVRSHEGLPLANAYIVFGSHANLAAVPAPESPITVEHANSVIRPHVVGLMTGQPLTFFNAGPPHMAFTIWPKKNREQVFGLGAGGSIKLTFDLPEIAIPIKCQVHPGIQGWIHVSEHPYFAITGEDGAYSISSVPPGRYEVFAWHEKYQAKLLSGKAAMEDGAATLDFAFTAPR